ncbi:MAG TPA: PEP-CTERM sorting domain-containing protein [Gemmatales bacterium]|nr:PEP-CTERM sorting domain-containing protein [Gemmatales bacterium]HMP58415.1 PEP-CTERM sorting domain-containing protein [Gemmatales bacterium]
MLRSVSSKLALGLLATLLAASPSFAQVATFANVFQQDITATPFTFTNNLPGTSNAVFSVNVPIFFNPSDAYRTNAQIIAPSFPGAGLIAGNLNISISTTTNANVSGGVVDQFVGNPTGTLVITSSAPIDGRTILLQAVFNGVISGQVGNNAAGLTSSTPGNITSFTSEFVAFNTDFNQAFSLSFTNLSPGLGTLSGSGFTFMSSWTASGTGLFSAAMQPIPEPATVALLGVSLSGAWIFLRRRKLAAQAANPTGAELISC